MLAAHVALKAIRTEVLGYGPQQLRPPDTECWQMLLERYPSLWTSVTPKRPGDLSISSESGGWWVAISIVSCLDCQGRAPYGTAARVGCLPAGAEPTQLDDER